MQVDRHNILWHRGVMLVQCVLVSGWLTVFGLLGGHWYSLQFLMCIFFLSLVIAGLWRMRSAACQSWGNVWCSNNASVFCEVKWGKQPVITGIIKIVRGSLWAVLFTVCFSHHHKLLSLHLPNLGLRTQKITRYTCLCLVVRSKGQRTLHRTKYVNNVLLAASLAPPVIVLNCRLQLCSWFLSPHDGSISVCF